MAIKARIPFQGLGVVLLTLAAINGYLATVMETCTQGGADSLLAIFLSLPLYALGFAAIIVWPLARWAWIFLLPAFIGMAYHLVWTLRFAFYYLAERRAVCDLITGDWDGRFGFDGREPLYLAAWTFLSVMIVAGTIWAARRTFKSA